MACGLPVITTEVLSDMDLVNDTNGVIVDAGDIEQLTSALTQISDMA